MKSSRVDTVVVIQQSPILRTVDNIEASRVALVQCFTTVSQCGVWN